MNPRQMCWFACVVVAFAIGGPGVGVMWALTCNSKEAPPATQYYCGVVYTCINRKTEETCTSFGLWNHGVKDTWGPCQDSDETHYCFNRESYEDACWHISCKWIGETQKCEMDDLVAIGRDMPVQNYDCTPPQT